MEDMAAAYYYPPSAPRYPTPASHYPYYPPPPPPEQAAGPPPPLYQAPPYQAPPYPAPSYDHLHPPPFAAHYAHPPPPHHDPDEVRTLFIAGLPEDTKQREIFNLFREFPGYKSCQLRASEGSNQAYAFAVFTDQQSAVTAMHALNGMVFDLERESTLHIDLAKSNSRSKRPRADDGGPYSSDKKAREPVAISRGFPDSGVGSNMHMPGMSNSGYSMNGYPSTQSYINYGYEAPHNVDPRKGGSLTSNVPQNNIPCPTLFVASLGPTCSQQELTQVFSRCPGFLKLKMQNKNGVPVAFVDFRDEQCSAGALNYLQGTVLHSSVGEGMRLEYAKSRMGLRRREAKA